jgi:hypothetical protein
MIFRYLILELLYVLKTEYCKLITFLMPQMEVKSFFRENVFFAELKKRPKEALLCSWKKAFSKKNLQRTAGLRPDKIKEF